MASRRKLKKRINEISSNLLGEIYLRYLLFNIQDEEKINQLLSNILLMRKEFISRINHIDGKNNPVMVKKYFRQFFSDWGTKITEIIEEIEKLNPEKQESEK